jgi:hypothetical protein
LAIRRDELVAAAPTPQSMVYAAKVQRLRGSVR